MSRSECTPLEAQLDALSERVVEMALTPAFDPRGLVPALAAAHPGATVLDVAAAIGRAALALEEADAVEGHEALAGGLHRIAARTAIDAWTVGRRGWRDARMGDLGLYRRIHGALEAERIGRPRGR